MNYQKKTYLLFENLGNRGKKAPQAAGLFFSDLGSENWGLGETGIPFNRLLTDLVIVMGFFFAMSGMAGGGGIEQGIKDLV